MNLKKFQQEYGHFLKKHADPQRAAKEKAYLYSDCKHYGVSVGERRKFVNRYKKELLALNKKQILNLVKLYWAKPFFEEKSLALSLLNFHKDKLTVKDMPLIEKMMRESKGWAFLDSLIIPLMPVILKKESQAYAYLKKWIKDRDFWVRRSALLAQNYFFRYNRGGDKKLFFKLAESQFDESWIEKVYSDSLQRKRARFFIRKAIGWAIREMGHQDPKSAFKFLQKNKEKMSGLSFRDGSRKLPEKMQQKLSLIKEI